MTEPTQAGAAPAGEAVTLDAVAAHLRRRLAHVENDALLLAITVRNQHAEIQRLTAELEAKNG